MESKICKNCKTKKDLESFYRRKKPKNSISSFCKDCDKERSKIYDQKRCEKIKENKKRYYIENKEKCKELQREWRLKNRERSKELYKQWRLKNIEKWKEQQKRYKSSNLEKARLYWSKWYYSNPEKVKEYVKQYKLANPEKIKKASVLRTALLKDYYVCRLIMQRTGLSKEDILQYPELIEAKRAQLMILREINKT